MSTLAAGLADCSILEVQQQPMSVAWEGGAHCAGGAGAPARAMKKIFPSIFLEMRQKWG